MVEMLKLRPAKQILMSIQERANSQTQSEPQQLENNYVASSRSTLPSTKSPQGSNVEASSASNTANTNTPMDSGPLKHNVRPREDSTTEQDGLERPQKRARTLDIQIGNPATSQHSVDKSPSNEKNTAKPPRMMTSEQQEIAERTLDMIRNMQAAGPFLDPVDPEAARAPDYNKIIQRPMDLGTIKRRLRTHSYGASSPIPYSSLQEFVDDVELVFENCFRYNGVKHGISLLAIRVKDTFDRTMQNYPEGKGLRFLPVPEDITGARPQSQPAEPKDVPKPSNHSPSTTQAIDNAASSLNKKRHNQLTKQLTPVLIDHRSRRDPLRIAQDKFCKTVLDHLYHKGYQQIVAPFLRPVDLDQYPDYLQVISQPMDLLTIQDKHSHGAYATAEDFHKDIKLIFENCYKYNPQGTPVWQYGKRLEKIVDDKWKELPTSVQEDPHKQKRLSGGSSSAPSSKTKPTKSSKPAPSKKIHAPLSEDQKVALCDILVTLSDSKMREVISLLRKRMPQFRENEEEVELEFQNIPPAVQAEMYDFLKRPQDDKMQESTESSLTSDDSESSFSSA